MIALSLPDFGGADIELTVENLHEMSDLLAKVPVQGARYNGQMQKMVNR